MTKSSDTFCVMPFMHLNVRQEGSVRICNRACLSIEVNSMPASLYEHGLDQIWNSAYMRDVRRKVTTGQQVEACSWCYEHEAKYGKSHRTLMNEEWLGKLNSSAAEMTARARRSRYRVNSMPVYFHLNLGRLCNLKCRMCNSGNSSQIERDPVHRAWAPPNVNFSSATGRWIDNALPVLPFDVHGVRLRGFSPLRRVHGVPVRWTRGAGDLRLRLPLEDWPTSARITIKKQIIRKRNYTLRANGVELFRGFVGEAGACVEVDIPPPRRWPAWARRGGRAELRLQFRSTRPGEPGDGEATGVAGLPIEQLTLLRAEQSESQVLKSRLQGLEEWFDTDEVMEGEIGADLDAVRMLGFTGGEPFLQPQVWTLLQRVADAGRAGQVEVQSNTNLTRLAQWQLELLARFARVKIAASIDALDRRFEYIRYPARWDSVSANLERLARLPNVTMTLVPVVQILSVEDVVRVCDYAVARGHELSFQHGYHPDYLSVTTLPRRFREQLESEIGTYANTLADATLRHNVESILGYLLGERDTCNDEVFDRLLRFNNDLDGGRGQRFAEVYPRVVSAFEAAGFRWTDATRFLTTAEPRCGGAHPV